MRSSEKTVVGAAGDERSPYHPLAFDADLGESAAQGARANSATNTRKRLKVARATLSLCGRNDILLELAVGHPEGGEPERLFRILQGVTPRRHAAAKRLRGLRKVGRLAETAER